MVRVVVTMFNFFRSIVASYFTFMKTNSVFRFKV